MTSESVPNPRSTPLSELDLVMRNTNPEWGSSEVNQALINQLTKHYKYKDEAGEEHIIVKKLWDLLHMFNRDIRLANLSPINGELQVCRYLLELAADFLQADMKEAFITTISQVATITETSQSKGGFLRRMTNTLIQESRMQQMEPEKKSLFGKKNNSYNY